MIEIWYGELWDGVRSAEACLADAVTKISQRNTIVGQFLQRCLATDPEQRPYPYDLYTFFSTQCQASSTICLTASQTLDSLSSKGERRSLEDQEAKLRAEEAHRQRKREELKAKEKRNQKTAARKRKEEMQHRRSYNR